MFLGRSSQSKLNTVMFINNILNLSPMHVSEVGQEGVISCSPDHVKHLDLFTVKR